MAKLRMLDGGTSCSEDDMFSRSAQESCPWHEDITSSEGKDIS